jgi:membrane AbrB-like protein
MPAAAMSPVFMSAVWEAWPYLLGGTAWAMLASAIIGLLLTRHSALPGTEAVWGLSPGGASLMTAMSADYGADMRMVASMQYLRVVAVSLCAVLVSRFFASPGIAPGALQGREFFPALSWPDLGLTLAAVLIGQALARLIRFPGGSILGPMILCAVLKLRFGVSLDLPPWFLCLVYASLAWRIGLSFSAESMALIATMLPAIFLGIFLMVASCAAYAVVLVKGAGFSPLTAYLATCPGGLDATTVIAAGSGADLPIVAANQTLRIFIVVLAGPWLAKLTLKMSRAAKNKKKRMPKT